MKLFKFLAPVTIAAALALTACTPAAPHAADVPYPTYTPATVSTPTAPAPTPAAVKAPKVKAPAAVKAPAPKVAKVATPPAAPMDTITAPVPAAAPVIPAAYVPCSAVGMVADAHGVCHKPVKAPAAHTCTGHELPGLCNMAGGPGMVIPKNHQFYSVIVHYTGNTFNCEASVYPADTPSVPCSPSTLHLEGNLHTAPYQVPCTLSGVQCTATTQG